MSNMSRQNKNQHIKVGDLIYVYHAYNDKVLPHIVIAVSNFVNYVITTKIISDDVRDFQFNWTKEYITKNARLHIKPFTSRGENNNE